MRTPATTSQTVGPFFKIGLEYLDSARVCTPEAKGEHIVISGQVFDGDGQPVPDGQLEVWQADSEGQFTQSDSFCGFARVALDENGGFRFETIKPGSTFFSDGRAQAPHIAVMLFMRGVLKHLHTRIYFEAEALNSTDPVLEVVGAARQKTLTAHKKENSPSEYLWNIHLQGDSETVFFEY